MLPLRKGRNVYFLCSKTYNPRERESNVHVYFPQSEACSPGECESKVYASGMSKHVLMDRAKYALSFENRIDFDNSSVIDEGYFRIRKTLEAWHISTTYQAC